MNINIIIFSGIQVAEITSDSIELTNEQDAVDIMIHAYALKVTRVLIHKSNITPAFYDLKTGIAGQILQKFSDYSVQLIIVGDYSKHKSKSLRDFLRESNHNGHIIFAATTAEVDALLINSTKRFL